jgi:hypothetical protein
MVTFKKSKMTIKTRKLPANFFTALRSSIKIKANEYTVKVAAEVVQEAKNILDEQRYKWKPLNPDYLDEKIREGLDQRILIATKDYMDYGIKSWVKDGYVFVGPTDAIHETSGLTYKKLAQIHEWGTWCIPSRPLWRPLLSTMIRRKPMLQIMYRAAVRKEVRRLAKIAKATVKC